MKCSSTTGARSPGRERCAARRDGASRQRRDAAARHSRDTAWRSQDAFTLLELLVVMGIMGVMVGITAASYVGVTRRASREGARENVMDILRQARVSAVDTGRGAVVRIDPAANSLYGIATDVIGAWHFEEIDAVPPPPAIPTGFTTPGARRYDGTVNGAALTSGKLGLAFSFRGGVGGNNDYVDCGNAPIWNQTTGIRLEAWVRPDSGAAGASGPIMSKESTAPSFRGYFIGADYNGDGTVNFEGGFAVPSATGGFAAGTVYLKSTQTYSCGQWHSVAAEFDGFQARLFVDGAVAASNLADGTDGFGGKVGNGAGSFSNWVNAAPALMAPASGQPLYIGRGLNQAGNDAYFAGAIDEPRVLSIAGGSPVTLPQMVPMVTSAQAVYYDAQGFLNLAYHTGPVYLAVGDPYQSAELAAPIDNVSTAWLSLRPTNPFPPTGGLLLIVSTAPGQTDEVVYYDNTGALTRNRYSFAGPGPAGSPHNAGDKVYFARVIQVGMTGLVTRP